MKHSPHDDRVIAALVNRLPRAHKNSQGIGKARRAISRIHQRQPFQGVFTWRRQTGGNSLVVARQDADGEFLCRGKRPVTA
jgi:hypothetical protein